jgi:predicted O-linked N-acetylglucosamine transferase (SPINDLY family)
MMLEWLFRKKRPGAPLSEKIASPVVSAPAPADADQPDRLADAVEIASQHPLLPAAHFNLGEIYLEVGRIEDAKACFEETLALKPDYAEAHYKLGNAVRMQGKLDEALACYRRARSFKPNYAEAHNNEGLVHEERRQRPEAIASYRAALSIDPSLSGAHYNLGLLLMAEGNLAEALACVQKAISINPDFPEAHSAEGIILEKRGHRNEAIASHRRALSINPNLADAHYNLGLLFLNQRNLSDALACFRKTILLRPQFVGAHNAEGFVHQEKGDWNGATAAYERALSVDPESADAHNGLGATLRAQGNLSEAAAAFRRAVSSRPDFVTAHSNLGMILAQMGRHDEAAAELRRTLVIDPDFAPGYTKLLFCLSHDSAASPDEVFAEHRAFGDRFEAPFRARWGRHRNLPDPARRLRVGFVSADLRAHAVSSFIEPLWAALDPGQLEIWVYSNHPHEDEVTLRLKDMAHRWCNIVDMSDEELAGRIGEDGIDILFDLSGHTGGNRLLAFARKPAPVQVSWIGNPNTTGLKAMDYYLADRFSAPPGLLDSLFTEKIVRLPSGALFQPLDPAPAVNGLPALENGALTFGSFNRSDKLTEAVVALWSRVLGAVPGSRMLLGGVSDAPLKENLAGQFARNGIDRGRISFHPHVGMTEYLALHHRVDLILDTFPFAGGTTSCHAAWMGVPVLTLAGATMASRVGLIINSNIGLPEFIVESEDAFVAQAARWSQRLPELAALRANLRSRVLDSPLCQTQQVARWLERALRTMWQRWCDGKPPESFGIDP